MKTINLTKILEKYKSGWIALSRDYTKVIDHAEKFIDLQNKLKNKKDVVVMHASSNYYDYIS